MNLQPNELRLGILVYDSLRQKNITIQLKHFRELSISEKAFFDRYKAVEISEELLLEMGFEKYGDYWYDPIESDDYQFVTGGFARVLRHDRDATTHYIGHSKFIHQLQNLISSLTGEQLIC